jgi:alkanesulfonate monooxygenase SsuD/methylene tetrahydromethanopterin reductase-like flavin-dependent oxidoreductase (luciferase family)
MGANGLGLAVGFKSSDQLVPAIAAFRNGRAARTAEMASIDPPRPLGTVALMRSVIVGESDNQVRTDVIDDLLRLEEAVGGGDHTEANRPDRRQAASEQFDGMIASEVMIAGSPRTVARAIRERRSQLGFDLFLANVYAMGASSERIRTSLRLLAGPVREQLSR